MATISLNITNMNELLLKWVENYLGTVIGKKANVAFCELDCATAGVTVLEIILDIHAIILLVVVNDCNIGVVFKYDLFNSWWKTWFHFSVIRNICAR